MNKFWIAVVVIIIVVGGVWLSKNGGSNPLSYTAGTSVLPVASESKAPVVKTGSVKKTPTPVLTSALSYTQLVALYGDNRIQFDANCQAQPGNVVFKNGTKILLDNRSNQTRTISVNSLKYNLVPYGYQVILLSSSSLPQTIALGCNNLINVGTIQLQANISGQ